VGEVRRSFLDERIHSLGLVGGGERRVDQTAFVQQSFGQCGIAAASANFGSCAVN
jgi:hypothetical protein